MIPPPKPVPIDIKIKSSRPVALASAIAWRLASFSTIILSFSSNKPSSSLKFKPKISVLGANTTTSLSTTPGIATV